MRMIARLSSAVLAVVATTVAGAVESGSVPPPWDKVRSVSMDGDLRVFWNVCGAAEENAVQAVARGFLPVDLLGTYADYPGKQKENIDDYLKGNSINPWRKPEFFERIIRRNIDTMGGRGAIFVHDIEFDFEQDAAKAWADADARTASGARDAASFAEAYFREWATWYSLPCQWAKQRHPGQPVGIYGVQPFRRDYWGIAGKSAQQIDGTHRTDMLLWTHIDPHVDFYVASIYVFYESPDSIYYMASNVEENWQRTRGFGNKPVYAYEWLRYHSSNKELEGQELAPYLVEAMAVLPFFSGARGLVLWGWEPGQEGQPYRMLPAFAESLGRVADLSEKISRASVVIDEPAHVLWKERRPLVRKMRVAPDEWIVMAVNPWQGDREKTVAKVRCGERSVRLTLEGRRTGIFHIRGGRVAAR